MNIRLSVISAMYAARENRDRSGYLHRIFVMATSPKWSAL